MNYNTDTRANPTYSRTPADIVKLADFLDTRMRGPGGFRFGWDGIIGLIPGVGDVMTASMSAYVLLRAAALGAPPVLLLRMSGNILIENFIDIIPVVGNLFDFYWKANTRNLALLESFLARPRDTTLRAKIWVVVTLLFIFALMIGMLVATFFVIGALWTAFTEWSARA